MSQVLGENSLPKYTAIIKNKIQQVDDKVNKLTDGAAPGKFLGCSETGKITFYLKDHYDIDELVEKISEYVNSAAELNGYVQDFWSDSNRPDGDCFLVYYSPQFNNLYYDVRINDTWYGAHYSFNTNSWLKYIEGDEVDCATPVISIDSEALWNDHYYFPPYDIYCEKIEYPIGWQEPNGSYVELTKAEYDALVTKDPDTVYFVKDENTQGGAIYKNSVKYSIKGDKGDTGSSGVQVSSTEPTDPSINFWISENGTYSQQLTDLDSQISTKLASASTQIDAKVNTAKADIDTKATATIASIPSDYTTLSNDVDGLKEDLVDYAFNKNVIGIVNKVEKSYVKTDGTFEGHELLDRTDLLRL